MVTDRGEVRVLVVDDQEPFRQAMRAVVEATTGFTVVGTVGSAEASLEAVAALHPDLVLMDVHLPGMDGVEASRRLTATAEGPVVVLLSTYDRDDIDASGCGATAYVTKSLFGPERLSRAWTESGA